MSASICQSSTVTIAQVIVLQAERLAVNLVENRQVQVYSFQTTLGVLDSRINLDSFRVALDLLVVVVDDSLL